MTKLNQIIALEKGVKAEHLRTETDAYHLFQKAEPFQGLVRTYAPLEDGGLVLPSESKKVTAKVDDQIDKIQAALARLIDLTATKDTTNQTAKADIVVGGRTLATEVPVTTLLWLERKLVDLTAVISKLPVTDISENWTWDGDQEVWRSETVQTVRSRKVEEFPIIVQATDKHPAQVAKVVKDVPEGMWSTTKLSGAASPKDRDRYASRVKALLEAVKKAREEANVTPVTDVSIAGPLLDFVFQE